MQRHRARYGSHASAATARHCPLPCSRVIDQKLLHAEEEYPSGKDCGGVGQPVCNKAPHCAASLFAIYPEGICVTESATAINCGSLGNTPCTEGRLCDAGLSVR